MAVRRQSFQPTLKQLSYLSDMIAAEKGWKCAEQREDGTLQERLNQQVMEIGLRFKKVPFYLSIALQRCLGPV